MEEYDNINNYNHICNCNCNCIRCLVKSNVWLNIGKNLYNQSLKISQISSNINPNINNINIKFINPNINNINIKFIDKFNIIELNKIIETCLEDLNIKFNVIYKNNKSIEYNINNNIKIIIEQPNNTIDTSINLINNIKITYDFDLNIIQSFIKKFKLSLK